MKTRSLFLVSFSLLMAQAAFASSTNCVNSPNVPDGSGGLFSAFDCSFYREPVYPFDLTPFITYNGATLAENQIVPGFIVWTTDVTDVTHQTLTDPAAFQDILDFDANLAGGSSSQVYLFWPTSQGGSGFPSVTALDMEGYLVLPWDPSGVEFFNPGDGNHTYTVDESLPSPSVPEPSTLLLVFAGGLGTFVIRRRRS